MILNEPPVEAEIIALDINAILASGEPHIHSHRWSTAQKFFHASDALHETEIQKKSVLRLLGGVVSMHLTPHAIKPFGPMMQTSEGRTLSIEDIGPNDAKALKIAFEIAEDPWIKSRLGDAALSCPVEGAAADWQLGKKTVHAYLDYIESLFLTESAIHARDECHRTLKLLWVYCRTEVDTWERTWALVKSQILDSLSKKQPGLAFPLCREVIKRRKEPRTDIASAVETTAKELEASEQPHEASRYYQMAAEIWRSANNEEKSKENFIAQGEALATAALSTEGTSQALVGGNWMQAAILILQKNRADRARISILKKELERLNVSALDSFGHHEHSTDVTELVKKIHETIRGPTYFEALMQMTFMLWGHSHPKEIRRNVLDSAKKYPFSHLFSTRYCDSEGSVVATRPPLDVSNEDSVRQEMIHHSKVYDLDFRANLLVNHSTGILFNSINPPFDATLEIVEASPSIPLTIKETVARGLHSGISDDWIGVAAYLIPTLEAIVRFHLNSSSISTKLLHDDGTQEELPLSSLLELPGSIETLGDGLQFELQVLLVEPIGYNLRNKYAHGLLSDQEMYSTGVMNIWWIVWRIVLFPWAPSFMERQEAARAEV